MPRFPTSICERTFELTMDYISALKYKGPVALSCDDTKLHPTFRTYWDSLQKITFLVGGTGDPIAVPDPLGLREIMKANENDKATKVWVANASDILSA
jgi:hypothetical protein